MNRKSQQRSKLRGMNPVAIQTHPMESQLPALNQVKKERLAFVMLTDLSA
jgi:hypothetical protein